MWAAGHHSDSLLKEVPTDWLLREDPKPLGRDEEEAVDKDKGLGGFVSVLSLPPTDLQEKPQLSQFVTACLGTRAVSPNFSGHLRYIPLTPPPRTGRRDCDCPLPRTTWSHQDRHTKGQAEAFSLPFSLHSNSCSSWGQPLPQDIDKRRTQLCHKGPPQSEATRARLQLGPEQAKRTSSEERVK